MAKIPAETVSIIGGGSWGTALARLAAAAGRDVLLWMRDAKKAAALNSSHRNKFYWHKHRLDERIRATSDLKETADFAKFILIAVPSDGFRAVVSALGEHVGGDHLIVHGTKGIEADTLKRMSEIIMEETPVKRLGVLSGPNLAAEIMDGKPAAAVVASRYPEVVSRAQSALASPQFRVYGSRDLTGVEFAGAHRNVIATGAGIVKGLGIGDNAVAMLITRGAAEGRRLGVAMGAEAETFAGLSGIGDLITTCASAVSKNHQVGLRLGGGEKLEDILKSLDRAAEGIKTTKAIHELARRLSVDMPITSGVYAILYGNADPNEVQRLLMARSCGYEGDTVA